MLNAIDMTTVTITVMKTEIYEKSTDFVALVSILDMKKST